MFSVIYNINLVFVIIPENMSEETCTHQADNASKPVKCYVVCCFTVLVNYNLYTNAYPVLYLCYKLLLSFSFKQVGYQLSFSKLKCTKNYLRNSITQDHLECFIPMNVEKKF